MTQTYIIAEAGVNHNGSFDIALEMINVAHNMGADAIKFQMFQADRLVTKNAALAKYQDENTTEYSSQYEMLKSLELSYTSFSNLKEYADLLGIDFIVTPFDIDSLDYLVKKLKCDTIKISSGDINHGPLLLQVARSPCHIILSTGMSNLVDIALALNVIDFGVKHKSGYPDDDYLFNDNIESSFQHLSDKVSLLHCLSQYPAPVDQVNLKAMKTMFNTFHLPVGFSDHTNGIDIAIAAVARGARIIEKHFTLDRSMSGPDHKASLEPNVFKQMCDSIRHVEAALGDGQKRVMPCEQENKYIVQRVIVAGRDIQKSEILAEHDLDVKRASQGITAMKFWQYLGKVADRDYKQDEVI